MFQTSPLNPFSRAAQLIAGLYGMSKSFGLGRSAFGGKDFLKVPFFACNYTDILRFLGGDQTLWREPALNMPDRQKNGCLETCFIRGRSACFCHGKCRTENGMFCERLTPGHGAESFFRQRFCSVTYGQVFSPTLMRRAKTGLFYNCSGKTGKNEKKLAAFLEASSLSGLEKALHGLPF